MKKILLFTFLITTLLLQSQASLVKDISVGISNGTSGQLIVLNNKVLFSAVDAVNGRELWESDGTTSGTQILKLFSTGSVSSNPQSFFYWSASNEVIFTACSDSNFATNCEIYKTDGTTAGTILLRDMRRGNSSGNPKFYTEYNGKVYFQSDFNSTFLSSNRTGVELCVTDGTPTAGTNLLKNIATTGTGLNFQSFPANFTVANGKLYFSARESDVSGIELHVTDGTLAGTVLFSDINSGAGDSNPANLVEYSNNLFFTADDGINGTELWVSDGTLAGTQIVEDLYMGSTGSNPSNLTVYNNKLYFTADHPTLGTELFYVDAGLGGGGGLTIVNLANINPRGGSSNPTNIFEHNGKLYFSADDGTNGIELWETGGTTANTLLTKDINPTGDGNPTGFVSYNGNLYFNADNGINGKELWMSNGTTSGTVMVQDINSSGDGNPFQLIVANNLLFFHANDGVTGFELWKYEDQSLSVNGLKLENNFSLFPNPSVNNFSIESKYQVENVVIHDIQGKTVKVFESSQDIYNVKNLTSGMYFVKIKTELGEATKKLIKE